MKSIHILVAASSFLFLNPANAWDNTGHEVVAQIALDTLAKDSPAIEKKLNAIIVADPRPLRKDLLVCAIWPDLNKHRNEVENAPAELFAEAPIEGDWHFVDIPYEETDAKVIASFIDMPGKKPNPQHAKSTGNVVIAIRYYAALLKSSLKDAHATDRDRADYLSWLVHFVGDVHQPLHCVNVGEALGNYVPPEAGDRGGNGFGLSGMEKVKELHALWDDQLDLEIKEKGTKQDNIHPIHNDIEAIAVRLQTEFPKTHFVKELAKTDPKDWALESYGCRTNVYSLVPDEKPSDPYLAFAKATAEERITLAGYRLASVLQASLK
jgi:hypothetical protein